MSLTHLQHWLPWWSSQVRGCLTAVCWLHTSDKVFSILWQSSTLVHGCWIHQFIWALINNSFSHERICLLQNFSWERKCWKLRHRTFQTPLAVRLVLREIRGLITSICQLYRPKKRVIEPSSGNGLMFFWRVTWTQPGLLFESEYNGFYEIIERLIHLLPIPDSSHSVPWLCIQESEHSKLKQTKQNLKNMFSIVYISNISFVWWDHTQTDFLTKKKNCFYLST